MNETYKYMLRMYLYTNATCCTCGYVLYTATRPRNQYLLWFVTQNPRTMTWLTHHPSLQTIIIAEKGELQQTRKQIKQTYNISIKQTNK